MSAVDVAVGIIVDSVKNRVLVAQRNADDMHLGKWEFPGGKINPDESAARALKRELNEELGITVLSFEPFESLQFNYSGNHVNLNFFLVTDFTGQASGLEGQAIRWVKPSDLPQLDMLEANQRIIERLMLINPVLEN